MSGHISALSETIIRECFAAQSANPDSGADFPPHFLQEDAKMAIAIYEINPKYVDYLIPYAPHLLLQYFRILAGSGTFSQKSKKMWNRS